MFRLRGKNIGAKNYPAKNYPAKNLPAKNPSKTGFSPFMPFLTLKTFFDQEKFQLFLKKNSRPSRAAVSQIL
jgi:hypothetical protein